MGRSKLYATSSDLTETESRLAEEIRELKVMVDRLEEQSKATTGARAEIMTKLGQILATLVHDRRRSGLSFLRRHAVKIHGGLIVVIALLLAIVLGVS